MLHHYTPPQGHQGYVQTRFTELGKEKAALRQQLEALEREARAAREAAARADAAAVQERLFSAQKDWFTQQLQPLLQQPRPVAAALPPVAAPPARAGGPAGGAGTAPAAAGLGRAAASPAQPSSAAFMSEEDGDAADGAAAYADVGRLAQALAGQEKAAGAAHVEELPTAQADPAAGKGGTDVPPAEPTEKSAKRKGRTAGGRKAGDGRAAAAAEKPVKKRAPAKKTARVMGGGKQGKGGKQEPQLGADTQDNGGSPVRSAEPPAQPRKRARGATAAAAETAPAADADQAAEERPGRADMDSAPVGGKGEGGGAGGAPAQGKGRVLRARKAGLTMADDMSGSEASDGVSEAASCGKEEQAKRRRTKGAKQVERVREVAGPAAATPGDAMPGAASTVASPLLQAPSFGSPQAMRREDARDLVNRRLGLADPASPAGDVTDAASPQEPAPVEAAATVWEDPISGEVKVPARSRPALVERPNAGSEQNALAGGQSQRGALGVHSVVGAKPQAHRAGSQVPNTMRDPETFGIVRNPMAAMTSKVMEATKLGRQKTALSWGEKLAVKASER